MRILITGHLGLIGHDITTQLHVAGHSILGVDDLSHNCVALNDSPAVTLVRGIHSLPSHWEFGAAHVATWPELIIHCASPVGHARLTPAAQVAWQIVSDTQAVLDLAAKIKARLITFSSSEVLTYRGETDIRAQYSLGKLTSEAMVLGHPTVDARVVRPYNVTGWRQRADGGFVMARFRDAILMGEPLTVFGDGSQRRCFTHVSDFARFVKLLAIHWPERRLWSVFNPGNITSILGLVSLFHRHTKATPTAYGTSGKDALSNPDWRDTPERPLDMNDYHACQELGWKPLVSLDNIVDEHIKVTALYRAAETATHD